jgi:hypothetical protein
VSTTLTDEQIRSGIYAEVEEDDESDADGTDGTDGDTDGTDGATTTAPTAATRTGPTATPTAPTRASRPPSPAASSRSAPRSFSRTTGSSSRSPCRAARRAGSTTSSPSPTSSGWSPRAACARPGCAWSRKGETIPERQYATDISWRPKPFLGTVEPDRVANAFAEGATIVLQALHHTWLPLARFCRELEAELGAGVQANSYYTPRRSQGFAVHHDTHDVFVLQVAARSTGACTTRCSSCR